MEIEIVKLIIEAGILLTSLLAIYVTFYVAVQTHKISERLFVIENARFRSEIDLNIEIRCTPTEVIVTNKSRFHLVILFARFTLNSKTDDEQHPLLPWTLTLDNPFIFRPKIENYGHYFWTEGYPLAINFRIRNQEGKVENIFYLVFRGKDPQLLEKREWKEGLE